MVLSKYLEPRTLHEIASISHRRSRSFWRRVAPVMTFVFGWSAVIAPGVQAYASLPPPPPPPKPHTRSLTATEMQHIMGAQGSPGGSSHVLSYSVDSGPTYHWEGDVAGTNSGNGNKLTDVPLVAWTARGGLPVAFTLYHNSEGNHNSELGHKWTHSYDIYASVDAMTGNFTVHWGNDLEYTFTKNLGGSYTAPTGIYDSLTANGSPITSYDLKTKDQVTYHFTNPNGTAWNCASIADTNGNTIAIAHNSGNYVTSITDPNSRAITLHYDGSNRIDTVTDPLSRVWTISYNGSSQLTQVTWPSVGGSSYNEQFGYNMAHDITTYTDKRGHSWTYTYYSDDSLNTETDPCSNTTTYDYISGQTTMTDGNSHTFIHNYSSGKLSSTVDGGSNSESYTYDSAKNKTQVTDRRGHNTTYTYDSAGNVLTKTDPLSHVWTYTYNSKNEVLTTSSPLSNQVANTYDSNGNLTQTQVKDASSNVLSTTTYTINTDGTVATKTDPNSHQTTYGYNSYGELTSVTTPNSRVTGWTVNGLGVRTSRMDALSRTTNYTLDNWNRVTTIDYPAGTDPTFTYDANSNLTAWTDAQASWARVYDNDNRMTSESKGGTTEIAYSYDASGKKGLLSSTTDANSRTITYAYTNRNQLYTVTENSATTTYGYDANGNITSVTNPSSTTVANVYDNADRLTSVTNKNSSNTTLSSFSYTYNNDDQRATCTENSGDVVSWTYDAGGRLTAESRTGTNSYSASYTLNAGGNRTSQTVGSQTTSFTYNTDDELSSTSSSTGGFVNSYSYNANGEQTNRTLSGTSNTLAYDYDGQLTSITQGSNVTSFEYDALGRRYSRTSGGTTTRFFYDGAKVLLEKQGSSFTAAYAYGNGLIRKDGEYPLFDGLGSERTVTNSGQTVTGTIIHEAFGQTVATTGSSSNPYKFAATSGYRDDGDAGLSHVGARYYDAQVGRFITRDTELNQHPYLYCEHDPVNRLDPTGHLPLYPKSHKRKHYWTDDVHYIGNWAIGVGFIGVSAGTPFFETPIGGAVMVGGGTVAIGGGVARLIGWGGELFKIIEDKVTGYNPDNDPEH